MLRDCCRVYPGYLLHTMEEAFTFERDDSSQADVDTEDELLETCHLVKLRRSPRYVTILLVAPDCSGAVTSAIA